MKIKTVVMVRTKNLMNLNQQPEWACEIETECGKRLKTSVTQWNRPEVHHLQDNLNRWPSTFTALETIEGKEKL